MNAGFGINLVDSHKLQPIAEGSAVPTRDKVMELIGLGCVAELALAEGDEQKFREISMKRVFELNKIFGE